MLNGFSRLLRRPAAPVQATVEIYTWVVCPYCIRAKLLLWWKGVPLINYPIDGDEVARAAMAERANGRRSVPQIFINQQHIGGCDELYALERQGRLDALLTQASD